MGNIYRRKLIRTGRYSYELILPKAFVDINNLDNAYALACELRKDGTLVVRPEKPKTPAGGGSVR